MKKLILVTGEYPPQIGGVADYSYILVQKLKGHCDISVVNKKTGFLKDILDKEGDILFQYVPYMYNKFGVPLHLLLYFPILRFFTRKKIITTVHETYLWFCDFWNWKLKQKFYFPVISIIQRIILFVIIQLSDKVIIYDKKMSSRNQKIVFSPIPSNFEFVKAKKIEKNNRIWITTFAGTYREIENILKSTKNSQNIQLNVIGRCRDLEKNKILKQAKQLNISPIVNVTGTLPKDEIKGYLEATDIIINFYRTAGASLKSGTLSAAMEVGLPIVSNVGLLTDKEIFKENQNMILLHEKEPLEKKIEYLIENPELMLKLSKNARETYYTHICWENVIRVYQGIIDRI